MDQRLVSIVLPCYNPPPQWQERILEFLEAFKGHAKAIELIVVNDGCTSDTAKDTSLLTERVPFFHLISYKENRGKGYAIRQGVRAATGDLIIYTDIDFPYTTESFLKIYYALLKDECTIAVGVKDDAYYSKVPFFRKKISQILRRMIRTMIHLQITDTQCGLKGLQREARELLLSGTIDRYLFDLEFIYKAEKKGLRLKAIPVTLREGVQFSKVKWGIISGEFRNFLRILRS